MMTPKNKPLWLFAGTSDGNNIARILIENNCSLKLFVATQYGKNVAAEILPHEIIETGRLSKSEIIERAKIQAPSQVVDATHPFAQEISKNLMEFCHTQKIPYTRYERPEEPLAEGDIHFVDSIEQAAQKAETLGQRILLTLGSKNIEPFLCDAFKRRIYIRMLPDPQLIEHILSKGVSPDRIIAIQGPFSIAMNRAMLEHYSVDCLITKSSGKEGGVPQKIAAANELGIPVIVVKRPDMIYPLLFSDANELIKHINKTQ
jgi:precorrin-6x reductase